MIVQKVIITDVSGESLLLNPVSSGCNSCKSGHCGAASLATLFGKKNHDLRISDPGGFILGEEAELLLDESFFLKTVAIQYLLPLTTVLIAVVLADIFSDNLPLQVLSALSGLVGGVVLSRYYINRITLFSPGEIFRIRKITGANDAKESCVQVMML